MRKVPTCRRCAVKSFSGRMNTLLLEIIATSRFTSRFGSTRSWERSYFEKGLPDNGCRRGARAGHLDFPGSFSRRRKVDSQTARRGRGNRRGETERKRALQAGRRQQTGRLLQSGCRAEGGCVGRGCSFDKRSG